MHQCRGLSAASLQSLCDEADVSFVQTQKTQSLYYAEQLNERFCVTSIRITLIQDLL